MNVLITGGCGFIGSFVAERFHKEGHAIYIIDNLSTGQRSNVTVPHKFYEISVEDRKCESIFQSIAPDIVIHLAAQVDVVTSVERPHIDTQSNILGLVNILRCAQHAGASKLIFASSAATYGPYDQISLTEDLPTNPVSPYGINKKLGEYYCEKWKELYNLDTLCFRFSNVYGPRQGSVGEGGVVSIFMERLRDGKELSLFGDGGQTRDFIYVKDLVDAIYRGSNSSVTGVYNLSTNTETSVNRLIEVLGSKTGEMKVTHLPPRDGDIYRSSLDNTRIKRDLDWVPIYSLEEGLDETYNWFLQSKNENQKIVKKQERKMQSKLWRMLKPFGENLLAFALVAVITLNSSELLLHTGMDFKLIYVIVLGIIYGTKQSSLAAVLASTLYYYESLKDGRDWVSLLYDPDALFVIAMYLFFGLIIGYVSDKARRDNKRISAELKGVENNYQFLKDVYADTRKVKEELQRQLINSKDSIGRIYSIIKKLESMEPEEIVNSSVGVLTTLLESDRISVYSVNNSDFIRLMIKSNAPQFDLPKTMRLSEYPSIQEVVRTGKMFVNKTMDASLPMLIAPIVHDGQIVALVSVYDIAFERMNLNVENLFRVSVDLISGSLSRAFKYVGVTKGDRFIDDTAVLKTEVFLQLLETKSSAKLQHNAEYVLLDVETNNLPVKSISERLASSLRDSDYVGLIREKIVLLLSNSNLKEADFVMQRLSKNGITTRIISEDEVYG
ncbi:NAD-dependent epimerase/dehydratase family protein [Paenibacillus sp. CF384]|uniref:NAD-dependent epimerase/dehydratase family protein n=1 Tax=Paenibacillus sp. CF384 TaxID=1884382 RepID=UPI000898D0E1|nr:NAD-dependent epimerase/dehydratase family protein [Paenibacillus sp. CF384]SDW66295.1 Nucleoside-diphosphate-sugar epimerase [Paenibacillus sp. CF384]